MAEKATIRTSSGDRVTGEVVRREGGKVSDVDTLLCLVTGGVVNPTNEERVTVRDDCGNHWTGARQ